MSEQWTTPYFTADLQQVIQQGMAAADTMLMGRRTYEQMAAYWPSMSPPRCSRSTGRTQP
jgi:dihydrofolate reductase